MGADTTPVVPGPSPGGSDPVENLQNFIEFISGISGRLTSWQESLATLDLEMDERESGAEAALTRIEAQLDQFEDDLEASGKEAVAAVTHLAEHAEIVAGQELPAATAQIVKLDAAIEAQTSQALSELEKDADALNQQGYDVLKTACDGAERTVGDAQQSLDSGFQAFGQALEDATRLVETTSASTVADIDQLTQEVDAAGLAFSAAAVDATRVWSSDLPGLVNDAVPEHKRDVEELYQAFDEAEVAGFAEFERGLDAVIEDARKALDEGGTGLERDLTEAQGQLDRQLSESNKTAEVAEEGASKLPGMDDGSLISHLDYALDVLGTIDQLLKAM